MGGIDKGWADFEGKPLIAHVLERLQPQTHSILISANRNLDAYRALGYPVLKDRIDGFQGPLAGLASLLQACPTEWLATVPCDAPGLPNDYLVRMASAAEQTPGTRIVVAHNGDRLQPVHMLVARNLLDDLLSHLQQGGRKVRGWLGQYAYQTADFSDQPQAFFNLNHEADLRQPIRTN